MFYDDNGHPGWQRTLRAIQNVYWFKDMKRFIKKFVTNCISCMVTKRPTGRRQGKLHPIEKIEEPFHTLHIDHLGPFCKTEAGNSQVLTIVDAFTKFTWLEAVPNTSSKWVCQKLGQLIKLVHVPKRIITDRGKAFDCKEFRDFCATHNIRHVKNAIASPRSNGQVERTNRTVLESLTASIEGKHNEWDKYLLPVQRGINSTVNSTTNIAPSELLYGFRPNMVNEVRLTKRKLLDLRKIRQQAKGTCDVTAQKMKYRYDKKRRPAKEYKQGDVVLVEKTTLVKGLSSGKLVPKYVGPVKIIDVLGNDRYRVVSFSTDKRRLKGVVASDRLKPFKSQITDM
ncbi:hypothetical protein NQ317_017189 [Molorchus minor]|uniref:RNA-directed DNA polymerase n=1 Tax=Molorchus minor TaxID=1323400 RepID=A0ABQ9J096_9CUCU|nr:hypothetical protein NQ317_017189 [Molorchus minor]